MPEANNPEVTEDALQKSLDDLLAAAEANALNKGDTNAVSHSGTYGSEGPQGGGRAGYGDAGGLDKMMIAKMIDLGAMVPTQEFMLGFQEEEEKDEDSEMGGYWRGLMHGHAEQEPSIGDGFGEAFMAGYMRGHQKGAALAGMANGGFVQHNRPTAKSADASFDFEPLSKSLIEDPNIQAGVDASEFMASLTEHVGSALDSMQKSLSDEAGRQGSLNLASARAVREIGVLVKSQKEIIDALNDRLKLVESTPLPAKGAQSLQGAQAMAKSLGGEAGAGGGAQLSKSEHVATLSFMNLEKGIKEIGGRKTSDLVALAEAGNVIDEPTKEAVDRFLATHPNEAERARAYA